MTYGIYKLSFKGTDKVYIGQSVNIEKRYNSHLSAFYRNKAAKKLQEAYNTYGIPSMEILVVEPDKLHRSLLEDRYISEYSAYIYGFNTLEHADEVPINTKAGVEGPAAVYTKSQIEEVFYLLCDHEYTAEKISEETGVSVGIIYYISTGKGHLWLKEEYPEYYNTFISNRGHGNSAHAKGIQYPPILDPIGNIHYITNRSKFAVDNKLDCGALGRVLRGVAKTHKGWRLCPKELVS